MPRITERRRAERRKQILDAARACFQRKGLYVATMDDIIRACDLSAGAVYGHFKSKDELILAAVTDSLAEAQALLGTVLAAAPAPPPADLTRRLLGAISAFAERDGFDLKRIAVLGWSEAQRNPQLRAAMRPYYDAFLADLATYAGRWRGETGPSRAAADIARALLSLVLGFIAASAIFDDARADDICSGLSLLMTGSATPEP